MRPHVLILTVLLCGASLSPAPLTSSALDLRASVEQLVQDLIHATPAEEQLRVAVADFPDLQGITSDLGRYIASRVTTRLVQSKKFSVTERQRLTQVLAELNFSMSDLVDPEKAKKLKKMVGVDGLIVGTISDLGKQVDVDARLIEIETNHMIWGATVTIDKDQLLTQLVERGRELPGAGERPGRSLGTAKYQELQKLRVEVEGLQVTAEGDMVVYLTYLNKTRGEVIIGLDDGQQKTFVLDNEGNRFRYLHSNGLSGGLRTQRWTRGSSFLTLAAGERVAASFTFGKPREVKKKGYLFHLTSGQLFVKFVEDRKDPQPESGFTITIRDIQPR
jgi:TolB-like protein